MMASKTRSSEARLKPWERGKKRRAMCSIVGLVAGMEIVGMDFRDGILFVPEVLLAAKAMKGAMEILRPLLTEAKDTHRQGTVVIGTVKGDIHDIGKNLVGMMLEGAGFEVINLGINVDADKFIAAIREYNADILGMSALLTTTMPYMKTVINRLIEDGLRDKVIVIVGGAPLTEAFAEDVAPIATARMPVWPSKPRRR